MSSKPGVLFLSHQGYSFIDDLMKAAARLGLESYILSSSPSPDSRHRIGHLRKRAQWLRLSRKPSLTTPDVAGALASLKKEGKQVRACLSVWEGYRLLMAEANQSLGAVDEPSDLLARVLDKYALRESLRRANLSRAISRILTPGTLRQAKLSGEPKFVKPRMGLGSFGAFKLSPLTTYARVRRLKEEMAGDREYGSIFARSLDFVIEDYLPGIEVSFEVQAVDGRLYVLAVHEKMEVEQSGFTTLENISACPPVSLSPAALLAGRAFLERCFSVLGLRSGCFHIEAKWNDEEHRWEIIEINPRVGGALIKESIQAVTGGIDVLETWLRILLARTARARRAIASRLARVTHYSRSRGSDSFHGPGTFFKVYFGEPGRVIKDVRQSSILPAPDLMKIAVSAGAALPASSREIFLGQALWKLPPQGFARTIETLKRVSKLTLEISYEANR